MGKLILAAAMLVLPAFAHAGGDSCLDPLPAELPLNATLTASTCVVNPNEACDATPYSSPIATSRFTLDERSSLGMVVAGMYNYDPALYLTGHICEGEDCEPALPAGEYCLTVTAGPYATVGSCGCFMLDVEVAANEIFRDGFD